MTRDARGGYPRNVRGAVLAVVLVLLAAGMALAAAIATSAALEHAMSDSSASLLRARQAAETGLSVALAARGWSATDTWHGSGSLPGGALWEAEVRLVAARFDASTGLAEWLFEIESTGEAATGRSAMLQGFTVLGALPGAPRLAWWRLAEDVP